MMTDKLGPTPFLPDPRSGPRPEVAEAFARRMGDEARDRACKALRGLTVHGGEDTAMLIRVLVEQVAGLLDRMEVLEQQVAALKGGRP